MKDTEQMCEYNECENPGTPREVWQHTFYLCEECENKVCDGNQSGYCSMNCILGYGCDGSC
jgi:ribosomal protein S14